MRAFADRLGLAAETRRQPASVIGSSPDENQRCDDRLARRRCRCCLVGCDAADGRRRYPHRCGGCWCGGWRPPGAGRGTSGGTMPVAQRRATLPLERWQPACLRILRKVRIRSPLRQPAARTVSNRHGCVVAGDGTLGADRQPPSLEIRDHDLAPGLRAGGALLPTDGIGWTGRAYFLARASIHLRVFWL